MRRFADIQELRAAQGQILGESDWVTVTQEMIDRFAAATGDDQWIHIDRARAKASSFGTTIAHGFLTLSLIPQMLYGVYSVDKVGASLNYGCNKVRFPTPVPVGADLRMGVAVAGVEKAGDDGVQIALDVTFEVRDAPKPACVAQVVYRYYR